MGERIDLCSEFAGFDWDEGNIDKNWHKHKVSRSECEEVFFNEPLLTDSDIQHSTSESRYYALGQTDAGRQLSAIFTMRGPMLRVISAREISRRERKEYDYAKNQQAASEDSRI